MLLKAIQYAIQVADILSLPIFSSNKPKINDIINIFWELIKRLGFVYHILHNKKIMFKCDYIIVQNIIQVIYCKQKKFSHI